MSEEASHTHDDNIFKHMEIATPATTLTRPVFSDFDGEKSITTLRPVNIDIVITPCDNSIQNPYEYSTLTGKVHKKRKEIRKTRLKCRGISNFLHERRLKILATGKDFDEMKELIVNSPEMNLDAPDEKRRTALHICAANGADDMVQLLLQNGANPNVRDIKGNTPLHLAACSAKVPIITLLLSHGADICALDFNGQTPLHLALSRLKILKTDSGHRTSYSALKIKADVKDIADLLKEYLDREGTLVQKSEIGSLRKKLQHLTTEEEIDEFGDLLFDFTQMAIKENK